MEQITNLIINFTSFIIGFTSSLVASILVVAGPIIYRKWAIRHLRGVWVQIRHTDSQNLNHICFLEVHYSVIGREYRLDGEVYDEKFHFNSRWSSMNCTIDYRPGFLYYLYSGHHKDKPFAFGQGYGIIKLRTHHRKLYLHDGYFLDATTSATPISVDYSHVTSAPNLAHVQTLSDIEAALAESESPLREHIKKLLTLKRGP
ncbi:MAG: hypothetical protein EKK71_13395 [Candidatus Competibacteraceae bacterium]|nr:MAG: hypothetical protein EKK71_13395 [Candidatus Competibacteraceae bacterium]